MTIVFFVLLGIFVFFAFFMLAVSNDKLKKDFKAQNLQFIKEIDDLNSRVNKHIITTTTRLQQKVDKLDSDAQFVEDAKLSNTINKVASANLQQRLDGVYKRLDAFEKALVMGPPKPKLKQKKAKTMIGTDPSIPLQKKAKRQR